MPDIKQLRQRAFLYLTPEVAATAGLHLSELQQFAIGHYTPSDEQLMQLAQRMRLI